MSSLSRFGPLAIRSVYFHQQRGLASAVANSDPIQRLFVDRIREFKTSNRGLDEQYKNKEADELARLKKVYRVESEAKLAHIDNKFDKTANISLGDLDENKDKIKAVLSGEYQKQVQLKIEAQALAAKQGKVPAEVHHSPYHLPPLDREPYPELSPNIYKAPNIPEIKESIVEFETSEKNLDPDEFEKALCVRFGTNMPTIDDDRAPERDVVNFPRRPQLLDLPPTVFHVLPKSWFDFFHSKTGVTGGFTFATTFGLFLVSKEWIVMEHEILTGLSLTIIFTALVLKIGPKISTFMNNKINDSIQGWDDWQHGSAKFLDHVASHYKGQADAVEKIPSIYDARREDIQVQLEAEYRRRLKEIHSSTKQKLDYLVAVADSKRNIAHEHMVNWVIDNAVKSIGPKQEADVLDNCIVSLRNLAGKNANAI